MVDVSQKDYGFGFELSKSLRKGKRTDLSSEEPQQEFSEQDKLEEAALEQSGSGIKHTVAEGTLLAVVRDNDSLNVQLREGDDLATIAQRINRAINQPGNHTAAA